MKRTGLAILTAMLLSGLASSARGADWEGYKADCQKRWGHYPFQAKPGATTLTYDVTQCQRPALPYQGPQPPERFYAPLPDGCYHGKPCCEEDKCRHKLFQRDWCERPRCEINAPWK
jgi:hypothetical protein